MKQLIFHAFKGNNDLAWVLPDFFQNLLVNIGVHFLLVKDKAVKLRGAPRYWAVLRSNGFPAHQNPLANDVVYGKYS